MKDLTIQKVFLVALLAGVVYGCFMIFRPFLVEILAATILVTIFYTPYQKLTKFLKGKKNIAALIMCILIILLVIVPLVNIFAYSAQRSIVGYNKIVEYVNQGGLNSFLNYTFFNKFSSLGVSNETLKDVVIEIAKKANDWLVGGATVFIKGTTSFIISSALILLTMFFFFIDGEKMMKNIMKWTPLPDDYDIEIFRKFKAVSYSTMISTFVTAIAQGLVGAIAFMIVGLPAFFAGIAMGFLSLLPYFGAGIVWLPTGIYLLATGKIWQGIFMLAWGAGVIATIDNLIRAYIIKGKAEVHPIFVIFSILGGIVLFGFWGVIFGPLIISLTVTVFHLYDLEFLKNKK